jgi:4-hydroxy-tetrahydrodipicolinate synthase
MPTFAARGAYTALVTPFLANDEKTIDGESFDKFVEAQVAGRVAGVVPCGTTGESPTLSDDEQAELVKRTVTAVAGRVEVVAGCGGSSTAKAASLAKKAEAAGADGVMVVVPYYNRPSQEGLVQHFVQIARSTALPIVVYNIPGRSAVDLGIDSLARIVEACPNVVAVKEATGNVLRAMEIGRRFGDRLAVLSGDDGLTLPMLAVGATGVISVASNVRPRAVARVIELWHEGRASDALTLHRRLLPVYEAMFCEANPGPAKHVLAAEGILANELRLPMTAVSAASANKIFEAMAAFDAAGALP